MPTRIPQTEEHAQLVARFRKSLSSDFVKAVVDRALDQSTCCCIDGQTREAISANIAAKFSLPQTTCIFVGSAKLGFSIVKKNDKPLYRSFSLQSDIDIAIVDPQLFDRVWEQTFLGLKRPPNLGQPALEISGVRLMSAWAPMSHSTAISAPCCRSRYVVGLRCSLYANPPFSAVRRQGSGTNACSSIRF
jgi:hypothetical protein